MTRKIVLDEHMLVSAVRYACGRSTYIVGLTVEQVLTAWPDLSPNIREVIRRDVAEVLDADGGGMDMDRAQWRRLLAHTERTDR